MDLLLRSRRLLSAERLVARGHASRRAWRRSTPSWWCCWWARYPGGRPSSGRKRQPPREFRAEELELLNLLAHHVTVVFENARLFESATYEGLTGLVPRAVLEVLDKGRSAPGATAGR
jgi:hypothetical protein